MPTINDQVIPYPTSGRLPIPIVGGVATIPAQTDDAVAIALTTNVSVVLRTPPVAYRRLDVIFVQDATGGRAVTWGTTVRWRSAAPTILTAPNARTAISLLWDNGAWYEDPASASSSISDARWPSPTVRFAALGDSLTADGGWRLPAATRASTVYNWQMFGQILADSRAVYTGCYATAGFTTSQILAAHMPDLLAADPAPDYCVVLVGTNNAGSQFAEHEQIVATLLAAGIVPILCTLTPTTAAAAILGHNAFIRRLAAKYGVPLLDLYSAVIDHATGEWLAANTRDTIHPSHAGAWVMGQALADLLADLIPNNPWESWLPQADVLTRITTGSNTPLFSGGSTGTYPPNGQWSSLAGGHGGTPTYAAGTAGFGNAMTSVRSGSDLVAATTIGSGMVPGTRIVVAFRLTTDVVAASAGWRMGLGQNVNAQTPGILIDIGRVAGVDYVKDLDNKLCVFEMVVPSTWTASPTCRLDFVVATGDGELTLEQLAAWQLDLLGVPSGV